MRRQTGINGSKHESTYLTSIFLNISDGICVYVGMNLCTEINPPSYHAWRKIVEIQTKNGLCFLSTDSFTNRNRRRSVWSVIKHCVMQYISSSTLPISKLAVWKRREKGCEVIRKFTLNLYIFNEVRPINSTIYGSSDWSHFIKL